MPMPPDLFDDIVATYGADLRQEIAAHPECRYLLIERGPFSELCRTLHENTEAASYYHDNQESADRWPVVELVDLHNGDRYAPVMTTSWFQTHLGGEPIEH